MGSTLLQLWLPLQWVPDSAQPQGKRKDSWPQAGPGQHPFVLTPPPQHFLEGAFQGLSDEVSGLAGGLTHIRRATST